MIRVLSNGAFGFMGRAMATKMMQEEDMQVVAAVDVKGVGSDLGEICGLGANGVLIQNDLAEAIKATRPDVMLDFTSPAVVMKNVRTALSLGTACVVGTTGLTEENLAEADELARANNTAFFATSNFSISAVLMMRFAAEAAKYMPGFEIVETHHTGKLDAPSGTALTTAQMMSVNRPYIPELPANSVESVPGCRGGEYQGVRVHSLRLPGVISMQDCIFGAPGQILTIRAESTTAECFFPGVAMALRKIKELEGMTFGLDKLMD